MTRHVLIAKIIIEYWQEKVNRIKTNENPLDLAVAGSNPLTAQGDEMKEISDFAVLQKMADENMDIACSPPSNFKRSQTGKDGFGEITMAVGNGFIGSEKHSPILYLVNMKQFKEVKKQLSTPNP